MARWVSFIAVFPIIVVVFQFLVLSVDANAAFCEVASNFVQPIDFQLKPGDNDTIYIASKLGTIVACASDYSDCYEILRFPSSGITTNGERGFLSFTFHPTASSRYIYALFTDGTGDTQVSRFTLPEQRGVNAWDSKRDILGPISQPYSNHNGGTVAFGPDGYLYISQGDGGSGGDPEGAGQDISTQLGSILRIDVDGAEPYTIPSGNYVGADATVHSKGWRNPWRMRFDSVTGWLWVGDVGQNAREEVSIVDITGNPVRNYGWNCYEGNISYPGGDCGTPGPPYIFPVYDYPHVAGASITGGEVYRGTRVATHTGDYIFGDYVTSEVTFLSWSGTNATSLTISSSQMSPTPSFRPTSYSLTQEGELIACAHSFGTLHEMYPSASDCSSVSSVSVTVSELPEPTGGDGESSDGDGDEDGAAPCISSSVYDNVQSVLL